MRIADLRIENFRGARTGHVRFDQHSVLVGPNNCGKTTIIEALALLFGRDRMVRTLTEHDFFGGDPQPTDRIRRITTIIGFEGLDPTGGLLYVANLDSDNIVGVRVDQQAGKSSVELRRAG
jgi:putative ATP-dependent endonuclease of the OLD family